MMPIGILRDHRTHTTRFFFEGLDAFTPAEDAFSRGLVTREEYDHMKRELGRWEQESVHDE